MLALIDVLPRAFTSDPAVVERAQEIWPLFALMQPPNGAVFALDGILIGAGDTRFLMWGDARRVARRVRADRAGARSRSTSGSWASGSASSALIVVAARHLRLALQRTALGR